MTLAQGLSFYLVLILTFCWSNGVPLEGLADYTTSHVKADGSIVKISTFSGENALKTIDFINNDNRALWQQSLWPWQNQFYNNYYRQPYYYNNYGTNYGTAPIPLSGSLWNYFLNDWHLRTFPMPLVPSVSSYHNYGQQQQQYYPNNLVPGQGQQYIPQPVLQPLPLPVQGQLPPLGLGPNSGNFVSSSVVSNEPTAGNPSGNFVSQIVSQNSNQAEPTIINYTGNSHNSGNFVSSVVSNNQGSLYPGGSFPIQNPSTGTGGIAPPVSVEEPAEIEEKENENEVEKDD